MYPTVWGIAEVVSLLTHATSSFNYINIHIIAFLYANVKMSNPNPSQKLKSLHPKPVAKRTVSVRLWQVDDDYVQSLPNRTDWLREAVAEKKQRENSHVKDGGEYCES